MKLAKLTAILLVSVCQYVFAQPLRAVDRTADEARILAEIEAISRGYVARDPVPFEQIYLENYVSIREKPVYNVRDQLIAMMKADAIFLKAGKKLDYETLVYETANPRIRFYGRSAVVISEKKNYWQYRGQKCLTRMIATELWVKPENEWKLAAGHATTFQCDAKPYHPIHKAVAELPARGKPANADADGEQQLKELLETISRAQKTGGETWNSIVRSNVAADFKAVSIDGEVVADRSAISEIPASSRTPGMRNQDDALMVYPDAAVYTFKFRPAAGPGSAAGMPNQCSIFFARTENRWLVVGSHTTKYFVD